MRVVEYPSRDKWESLAKRPTENFSSIEESVKSTIELVKTKGDPALIQLTKKFDKVTVDNIKIDEKVIKSSAKSIHSALKKAIDTAYKNIYTFHVAQASKVGKIETMPGVLCWRKSIPIEKVGLYIPGGSAPLFSTVLMLGIPAQIAGCKEVILCTPPW